jgi:hypothetical protein
MSPSAELQPQSPPADSLLGAGPSGTKAFAIAVMTTTATLLLLCWLSTPRWQTNDDVAMSMVAHGYGIAASGSPPHLMFSNVLWGYLVRSLPTLSGIPGYSLATMGTLLIVGSSVAYALLRMGIRYACCAAVLVFIMARPILFPQFTVNAGLLMVASVMLLCVYAREGKTHVAVAACLLAFASYLVRSQEFLFVCAVGWTLLPMRRLIRDRKVLVGTAVVICAITTSALIDRQAYKVPEWRDFNALNLVRAWLTDFGAGKPLRERPDVLASHGFSTNDIALLENWFFVDPTLANPPVLDAMLSQVGPAPKQDGIANLAKGLKAFGHPSIWLLGLVAVGVSVIRPNRSTLAAWAIFIAAIAAIGYLGRPGILHVYIPLLSLLLLVPLARMKLRQRYDILVAVALGIAALVNVHSVLTESQALKAADVQVRARVSGVEGHPVIVWGNNFPFEAVYSVLGTSAQAMTYQLYGLGVSTLAPFSVARSESLVGRGLIDRLRSPEGALILANSELIAMLAIYCQDHFDGRLETIASPPADLIAPTSYRCTSKAGPADGRQADPVL